jgi:hypothetical protein
MPKANNTVQNRLVIVSAILLKEFTGISAFKKGRLKRLRTALARLIQPTRLMA